MYYQLTGSLEQLAFEYLDSYRQWNEQVKKAIAQWNCSGYYRYGHPVTGYWVGAVAFPDGKPVDGWRFDKSGSCYVPNRKTKAGKQAHAVLSGLGKEPQATKLFEAIGIEIPIEIGNRYAIPGLAVSRKQGYAVLQWREEFPEFSHPEAIEITTKQHRELTQEATA